jgi:hypothetical protein
MVPQTDSRGALLTTAAPMELLSELRGLLMPALQAVALMATCAALFTVYGELARCDAARRWRERGPRANAGRD